MLSMKSSSSSENVVLVLVLGFRWCGFGDFLVVEMEPKSLGLLVELELGDGDGM